MKLKRERIGNGDLGFTALVNVGVSEGGVVVAADLTFPVINSWSENREGCFFFR